MKDWNSLFIKKELSFINSFCSEVFYINLLSRGDRRISIETQLEGLNISASRIEGEVIKEVPSKCKINRGQLGCLLSHKKTIQYSYINNLSNICILEDDVVFKNNFHEDFKRFINMVPNNWDMIYLCGNNFIGLNKINNFVYKTNGTLTTSSYIVKNTIYKDILDIPNSPTKPIDSYYLDLHKKINAYVAVPSLTYQMAGFSDIEGKFVNYDFLK